MAIQYRDPTVTGNSSGSSGSGSSTPVGADEYKVKKGDTLYAIAKTYGTTVNAIKNLNPEIKDINVIYEGQIIKVSGTPSTVTPSTPVSQTVVIGTRFGLVSNSERELYVGWSWHKDSETEHYEVEWTYDQGSERPKETKKVSGDTYCTYSPPEYATWCKVRVRAIAKDDKDSKGNKKFTWTCPWAEPDKSIHPHYYKDDPPKIPGAPSVTIDDDDYLTAELEGVSELNATHIEFQIVRDNVDEFALIPEAINKDYDYVSCRIKITPGHTYKVRCGSIRNGIRSKNFGPYSGSEDTKPASASVLSICNANSLTSVYLMWKEVNNADTYEIEYATKLEYFNGSNQITTESGITTTSYILTGLESGTNYFFRVRAVNGKGSSAPSNIMSVTLGVKPSAPTTWSNTTTAIVGESVYLYWVHNSEDGSKQREAQLELTIDGLTTTKTVVNPNADNDEVEDKTSTYQFSTSGYVEGAELNWRVRTRGVTDEWSDWSTQKTVDIYASPTLMLNARNSEGYLFDELTNFPFTVTGIAGPDTQKPIGYYLTIVADETYESYDHIGRPILVTQGTEVYSKFFDDSDTLSTSISASDVDLENTYSYTIKCIVTMDSGLTAESSTSFRVAWEEVGYVPNAEIGIQTDTYSAVIRPYCEDANGELIEDVTLAVYRREYNGSYTEIVKGMSNTKESFTVDPHPALDYARYRIVATANSTGAVAYYDLPAHRVGGIAAVIQWDEDWSDFNVADTDDIPERAWSGSILKLPYNISVSNSHSIDTALVEYIGRKHPVSYYGTQLGETASWSMEIPKDDKETLYALRRLAAWTGDVYCREPSGSGYWANISVSFSQKYLDVTIPVTLEIKRVEGDI